MTDRAATNAPPDLEARQSADATGAPRPLRCLLVEDSRFDRSLVRYSAERGGVDIGFVDVGTLAEARERLAVEDFELVILDRHLPDGDGLDLPGQMLGGRNVDVPMIMLSGGDAGDLGSASARAGCVGFISRNDLSPEGLSRAVRDALARHVEGVGDAIGGDPGGRTAGRTGDELPMLLGTLAEVSRVSRMKPLTARLMAVLSELRQSLAGPDAHPALDEISELCLMLWLDLNGTETAGHAEPSRIGHLQPVAGAFG